MPPFGMQPAPVSFWIFRFLGFIFLMMVPLVFLMRRPKGKAAVAAH